MKHYDLVVIGAGPGGTPVAIEYAKLNKNKSILLIDGLGKLGGECLFQGCIPSKIIEASSHYISMLQQSKEFGIEIKDSHYQIIWEKIKNRKETILDKRNNAAKDILGGLENITFIQANASFSSKNSIKMTFENGEENITFSKAVIATGSHSFIPHYEGNGVNEIWTNSDFFAKMQLPQSLSIIGSGAIAVEFAMFLATLGVRINIFSRKSKVLLNLDSEASDYLTQKLQNNPNINLLLESHIKSVDFEDDNFTLHYMQKGEEKTLSSQQVLSAAGRVANIDSLALEVAGVKATNKGIEVDKHLQTSNKNIYANGDVALNFPKFAHTAQFGAHTIAQNLFLEHNIFSVDFDKNSWVLFSSPNVAMAGIDENEAKKRGIEVIVDKFEFATEAKSQIQSEDYGYLKFIVKKSSNQIIGISIMHQEAHSLASEAALIVSTGLKLKDLINSIHPHPTIGESYVMLAKKMMGDIMMKKLQKPAVKVLLNIERWL